MIGYLSESYVKHENVQFSKQEGNEMNTAISINVVRCKLMPTREDRRVIWDFYA